MTPFVSVPRRGPSSYHMQNPALVFDRLGLRRGSVLLDLGCGPGDYALQAAEIVGTTGRVHAMDLSESLLRWVAEEAVQRDLTNVSAQVGDMRARLPFDDETVDVCLIAQVLHALPDRAVCLPSVFGEVFRVLRARGTLAIIECKKEDACFGPPLSARLGPEDLIPVAETRGFAAASNHDLGVSYLLLLSAVWDRER
ncbi:methyltransferase domain-containing protein [Xanthobacteraceae bacterium Astr-EGSB]|uniref:class I SAM-dependent methyltransferase n=1 Tax=Astrobacterium formosum TaxID=3069710 RepID=UPI0027B62CD3|nr:methyltransferase domain-containing protein [Xanthobacteraceae bacterium Astr-EGSB]